MNFTLLVTVVVTGITLVAAAYIIAKLIGPRSYVCVCVCMHVCLRRWVFNMREN